MTKSKLEHAYGMMDRGFGVFPISPNGKLPTGDSHGHQDASFDRKRVKDWWDEDPDRNIGICPGPNCVVIDLDMKPGQDGVRTICDVLGVESFEIISETFTVKTTTGGYHLYYKCDEEWGSRIGVLPDIDIRGVNGYVLGPGSTIDGKSYDIYIDEEMIPVREDLKVYRREPGQIATAEDKIPVAGILDSTSQVNKARKYLDVQIHYAERPDEDTKMKLNQRISISGDSGNRTLYDHSCELKDLGVSRETVLELMTLDDGWNDHCDPPWSIDELETTINHAFIYGKSRPGSKGGGTLELFEEMYGSPISNGGPPKEVVDRFAHLKAMTFRGSSITKRVIRREMIIPEWFPAAGFTAILSKRGDGKSVLMLDMAMRVACNIGDWHGYPISQSGWKVVYCCGEDDLGFAEQQKAWIKHHGVEPPDDKFITMTGVMDLTKVEDAETWAEYLRLITDNTKTILFVDTWQRATAAVSQSDDDKMQYAIHCLEKIAKSLKGPCMAAFHPPKNNTGTIIGSSTIENASVAILTLEKGTIGRRIEVERMKGKGEGNYQLFKFQSIGLEEYDEFNQEYTGVVPVKIGGVEAEDGINVIRGAFAAVVKELEISRKNNFPDLKSFTVNGAAKEIYELKDNKDIEWAGGLLKILSDAGVSVGSITSMRNTLTDLFIGNPTSHSFGDGNVLEIYKQGAYKYFRIRPDGMGDKNETSS